IPFSTGSANCVDRNIAMLEVRLVLAYAIRTFEMRFAEGYDERRWETDLKNQLVL
ncbi:hypothetical protein C8R44DRAFT_606806, partial [Mycena epipterygia]